MVLKFIPGNPPRTPIHFIVSMWTWVNMRENDGEVEKFLRAHLEEHFLSESMLEAKTPAVVKYVIQLKDHSEGAAAQWVDLFKYGPNEHEIARSKLRSCMNTAVQDESFEEFKLVTLAD